MWLIHGTNNHKDMEAFFNYESHPLRCLRHLECKLINHGLATFKVAETHCNLGCDHNLLFVCQYPHHCVPLLLTHRFDNAIDKVNTTANKLTLWYILHYDILKAHLTKILIPSCLRTEKIVKDDIKMHIRNYTNLTVLYIQNLLSHNGNKPQVDYDLDISTPPDCWHPLYLHGVNYVRRSLNDCIYVFLWGVVAYPCFYLSNHIPQEIMDIILVRGSWYKTCHTVRFDPYFSRGTVTVKQLAWCG